MDIGNHCQYFGTYSLSLCPIHTHTCTHIYTNTHFIFFNRTELMLCTKGFCLANRLLLPGIKQTEH